MFFRSNLFSIPSGDAGREYISHCTFWLRQVNACNSELNAVAMKAFMVIPCLLLQKPSKTSKAKDHSVCLSRRLKSWKDGDVITLLREIVGIQQNLTKDSNRVKKKKDADDDAKIFARLVMQGKLSAAIKFLDKQASSGVLPLSREVISELKEKHPMAREATSGSLLFGPVFEMPVGAFNTIDERKILAAALRTKGSAGPSGVDANVFRRMICSKNFGPQAKSLREEIALLCKNMLTEFYDPSLIAPLTACRLIPLSKGPSGGIRPIGVGEVLRRIMGKVVASTLKEQIKEAAGPLQTCASHGAGAEAAIHSMREIFEKEETDGVLLIDASNAFNNMNRAAALHNIQIQCPSLSKYIINQYRKESRLFITGGAEIQSQEGTTQGDPLAMAWYSIATSLLITILRRLTEKILQAWLADDAAAAGALEALLEWYDHLVKEGVQFGYFVNGKKSWLIVKTQEVKERAEKIFGDRVNITTEGQRHLGAVLGSKSFKDQYCEEMVDKWTTDLKVLCEIAHTQPQAAYISFTKAFKSKFTYFQRTIPSFEQYLEPLQDVINRTFVPAIIGQDTPLSDQLMACFSLPTSRGGLNIPDLQEETPYQHSSSKLITNVHTESILRQEECMLPCSSSILIELEDGSTTGATPNHLRAQFTSEKVSRLRVKIEKVMKDLPEELRDLVMRHQDRGASFWLEAIPLEESDCILSKDSIKHIFKKKEVFKDGLRLRYDLPLPSLPSSYDCGDKFTVNL